MKLFLISVLTLLLSCEKANVVLSIDECHESACTDLKIFDDGTFELNWTFPSGSSDRQFSSPPEYYTGYYLVQDDRILLYTDSTFDYSKEADKLSKFRDEKIIYFENRNGMNWNEGTYSPKWHM